MSQNIVDKDIDNLYNEIEILKENITSLQSDINSNYSAIINLQNKKYYYYDWPYFALEANKSASKTVSFNCTGKPFVVLFKVNQNCLQGTSIHAWTKATIARETTVVSSAVCEGYQHSSNEECIAIYLDTSLKKGVINYTFTIQANMQGTTYSDENATPKIIIFEI